MAVISVNEIASGRDSTVNEKGQRTYTRVFQVITNDPLDGPLVVRSAAGIPARGSSYITATEIDAGAKVKSINPSQSENPRVWEVRIDHDSVTEDKPENPLERELELSWSFAQFSKVADRDINGHALLNSAGDPFDPPPEMDDSRPVLSIVRNEATFSPAMAVDFMDAVNSDEFLGFDPGQVKVANISATRAVENDVTFWKCSYEFHFRREGWKLFVLDLGRFRTGRKPIWRKNEAGTDVVGEQVINAVPLDGAGQPLANPTPATAEFCEFDVYKQRAFADFEFDF